MDGIDGLTTGDPVTAEQMRALFGCGLHPLAELRQQQLEGPDLTLRDFQNVARLGAPFKIVDNDLIRFRVEVAKRMAALTPRRPRQHPGYRTRVPQGAPSGTDPRSRRDGCALPRR
jgi:hypothetical protein